MKKYLLLLPTLFLGGCFFQTVGYLDLAAAAERVCHDKGGVKKIMETYIGRTVVECFNAHTENVDSVAIEIENERNRK